MMTAAPFDLRTHLAGLDAIAARLESEEAGGGWLARAMRDHIADRERRRQLDEQTPAQELEGLLTSGLVGIPLLRALWNSHAQTSRFDTFAALAAAITTLQARATCAELDVAYERLREIEPSPGTREAA